MERSELMNLCYSCLIDGYGEHGFITVEDAKYTLRCWREEGNELAAEIKDLSADEFMKAWNAVYAELTDIKENRRMN